MSSILAGDPYVGERGFSARCVSHRPICMVITKLVVGEMGTEFIGITPSGMHYILQLNRLLWRPGRKCLLFFPGTSSRPADVFLPIWKRGQPAALDVTVISTLQNLTVAGVASTKGHALSVARERKMALHSTACHSVGVSFFTLVVESLGGWSDEAIDIIKSIGRLQEQRLGISPNESTQHLFQRLAVSL